MSKIIKAVIKISGMHCSSCALNIDFELEDLPGVLKVKTSYVRQEVEIEFNADIIKLHNIAQKIGQLGYQVIR